MFRAMSAVDVMAWAVVGEMIKAQAIYLPIPNEESASGEATDPGEEIDQIVIALQSVRTAIVSTWPSLRHESFFKEMQAEAMVKEDTVESVQ